MFFGQKMSDHLAKNVQSIRLYRVFVFERRLTVLPNFPLQSVLLGVCTIKLFNGRNLESYGACHCLSRTPKAALGTKEPRKMDSVRPTNF